jgi:hypothetical protein
MFQPYTVIGFHTNNAQIFSEHVMAKNRIHAFSVCAVKEGFANSEFVCSLNGHEKEGGNIDFSGSALVDTDTVLEQSEVFN